MSEPHKVSEHNTHKEVLNSDNAVIKQNYKKPMCMDIAPDYIAVYAPPDERGFLRTPWCHLEPGHEGPHVCGEFRWANEEKKL